MGKLKNSKTFMRAFRDTLPIFAGYLVLGFGFGVLLSSKGFNALWALCMSLTMYAGSMQYVAVDLLAQAVTLVSAALMTLLVNARHIFYGLSLIEKYNGAGKYRPYLMFSLTDETYSLVSTAVLPDDINKNKYYFIVSLLDQSYWVIGCTLGAIVGTAFSFNSQGIEFAMTALFVTIFTEQWLTSDKHANALIGAVSTLACLIVFGSENFLIPSMLVILILLTVSRGKLESKKAVAE